jgi:hypothetical protein
MSVFPVLDNAALRGHGRDARQKTQAQAHGTAKGTTTELALVVVEEVASGAKP